jgi:hypothetical protein
VAVAAFPAGVGVGDHHPHDPRHAEQPAQDGHDEDRRVDPPLRQRGAVSLRGRRVVTVAAAGDFLLRRGGGHQREIDRFRFDGQCRNLQRLAALRALHPLAGHRVRGVEFRAATGTLNGNRHDRTPSSPGEVVLP